MSTVEIISRLRVYPNKKVGKFSTVPLSIIDSTVARYGPTTAIWFFEKPISIQPAPFSELCSQIKHSLELTLDAFPQWCGLLHYMKNESGNDHTHRYRRLAITYGKTTDPGIELVIGKSKELLDSIIPTAATRRRGNGCWDGTHIPVNDLIPARINLSLGDLESKNRTLPCILIQVTEFQCGGSSVAVRSSHSVADSISLLYFVNQWAKENRAMQIHSSLPKLSPTFNPGLLDRSAAGDIDAATADPVIIRRAETMPMHRFDIWTQPAGNGGHPHSIPADFDPASIKLGTPPPPSDPEARISFCVLHFASEEIENIWKAANALETPVSHHDALCAHIWILINRSRGLENDDGEVHLDFTVGLRTRTSPRLPDHFLGSPTVIGDVVMKARIACNSSALALTAAKIRSTILRFDSESVGAVLHQLAFDESPQRYLHSSAGLRHVIQTSWMKNGAYDVDFGAGSKLRYAMAGMAMIDGFVQTMEAAPLEEGEAGDPGVDVSVRIETKAMKRLLVDPLLRLYMLGR